MFPEQDQASTLAFFKGMMEGKLIQGLETLVIVTKLNNIGIGHSGREFRGIVPNSQTGLLFL